MNRRDQLERVCREHGVLAAYLFGSRADDGLEVLAGQSLSGEGSDLDVGVAFTNAADPDAKLDPWVLAGLQAALDRFFAPLRIDLVPLQRVDPIFQYRAIDGHRIVDTDPHRTNYYELAVMRLASELLPVQRRLERERFGFNTT